MERQRAAERAVTHGRSVNLEVKARWRQEYKPAGRPGAAASVYGGLLCFRCNTTLGYVETYGELAAAYLANRR
jgi:hypothetical protein